MQNVPIIIVGGGPVGLSLALALSKQKIKSIVIEKHNGVNIHPRARGVNTRTMELFKLWGNSSELLKYEQPKEARRFIWAESFQGKEITRVAVIDSDLVDYSPIQASLVSQDHVEDSLYTAILSNGNSEVQFEKEFVDFKEDDNGVVVQLLDRKTNQTVFVKAQYLIAADGAHSMIRKQLDIEMMGSNNLGQFCSVYCEIDITKWTKHRPCIGFFFTDPRYGGFLASIDGDKRWIIGLRFSEDVSRETYTDEYCVSEVRRLVDLPNLDVKIISKSFWTMAAQIATNYRKKRVFLVGDAAHRLPPTGGFGMNTGIQDAHNLAWKLAFVLNYNISDQLLETYYTERAPIAKQNIDWSTENAKRYTEIFTAIHNGDNELLKIKLHEQQKHLNSLGLDLGFIYHSEIISSENSSTLSISSSQYIPTTLPGSRAPHLQVIKNGKFGSILDLFEKKFVLLVGADCNDWLTTMDKITQKSKLPIEIYKISRDGDLIDYNNTFYDTYEITKSGAVLIRPDGHVAWRSRKTSPQSITELENYFDKPALNV